MPTTALTFAAGETKARFQEPYVSEALNAKMAVVTPRGVYRGFRLATNGSALTVTVSADVSSTDHVAVYQTASGYSLTIRKTGGNFNVDLTAYVNKTVAIAIHATYSTVAATVAYLKIYEITPSDEFTGAAERSELIVLGTVIVPGAGVISNASILPAYRDYAWSSPSASATNRGALIKNHSFEYSVLNSTLKNAAPYWELYSLSGTTSQVVNTSAQDGAHSFEFAVTSTGVKTGEVLLQRLNVPAFADSYIRIRFFMHILGASSAGTLQVLPNFKDNSGTLQGVGGGDLQTVALTSTTGGFQEFNFYSKAPATDSTSTLLSHIVFSLDGANYGTTGAKFRIDNVQCFIEKESLIDGGGALEQFSVPFHTNYLGFEENVPSLYGNPSASLFYQGAVPASEGGSLFLDRRDVTTAATNFPPLFNALGRIKIGDNLLDTEARSLKPRIETVYSKTAGVDYTLIWQAPPSSGTDSIPRLYVRSDGSILFTINAVWGGTTFSKDDTSDQSIGLDLSAGGSIQTYWRGSGAGTFATFDQTTSSILDAGSDSNLVGNTLDWGVNYSNLLSYSTPRLMMQAHPVGTEDRTLMLRFHAGDSGNGNLRIYSTSTGHLEITQNAEFGGTNWQRDVASRNSIKLLLDHVQLKLFIKDSTVNGTPWLDSAWNATRGLTLDLTTSTITNVDGIYKITNATTGSGGSNPPQTTAITNEIRAKNIPKSFGLVHVGGAGESLQGTDGFNVASVSDTSPTIIRVTFAAALATSDFIVQLTLDGTGFSELALIPITVAKTTTYFEFKVYNTSGSAQTLTSGSEYLIAFTVFGSQ